MYALERALKIMEARWGHAEASCDIALDMLEVIRLLEIALRKANDFEEKFIETNTNQELAKMLDLE